MKHEIDSIMLFIAELAGSYEPGTGTIKDKIESGRSYYIDNRFHELDLSTESGRNDLHENIWLERLYGELDRYYEIGNSKLERLLATDVGYRDESYDWTVPIELDATASILQYIGALLNDSRLLNMTNVIGEVLEDAWKVEGLGRLLLKKAATPMLYASSQPCQYHWKKNKLKYKPEDIALYNKELLSGPLGLANDFKEVIVQSVKPKPKMRVKIWNEEFDIYCNRFRNVGDHATSYKVWDSNDKLFNVVTHWDTKKIADLEQFVRFFVTLLVHNLDSQVANKITKKLMNKYGWGIPIHDALVISPKAALDVRKWYVQELKTINMYRKSILKNYCDSIGVDYALMEELIAHKVVPVEGKLDTNIMALK